MPTFEVIWCGYIDADNEKDACLVAADMLRDGSNVQTVFECDGLFVDTEDGTVWPKQSPTVG